MQLKLDLLLLEEQQGSSFEEDGELQEELCEIRLEERQLDDLLLHFSLEEELMLLQLFDKLLKLRHPSLLELHETARDVE